jgi:hypothetical protein
MPVVVYQPGKVGSQAIAKTLNDMGKKVYHAHYIYNIAGEYSSAANYKLKKTLSELNQPLQIVTPIREPIARNLSAYFWSLPKDAKYTPDIYKHQFINNYQHEWLLNWFDHEFNNLFEMDIYELAFNQHRGYSIYEGMWNKQPLSILIVQQEKLMFNFKEILVRFFHTDAYPVVPRVNETKQWFYKDFKCWLKLPEDFLEKIYTSKYARHFYGEHDITHFKNKWRELA